MSVVPSAASWPAAHRSPWWLPGGHLQTIWPSLFAQVDDGRPASFRRERWTTPDQDFIDVDFLEDAANDDPGRPMLVLFHGLEGSSRSGYARAFACLARAAGWQYAVPHFRGCSGELNLAPRAYHSGDHEEIDWILGRFASRRGGPVVAVGVSLGGNMLLRWAEEWGAEAAHKATTIAAVCSPLDLAAGGHAMGRGFGRHTYARMFLHTMKPKALAKLRQHPGLFDGSRLREASDLYTFDNIFTAPVHGFRDTEQYWSEASSKPRLADIRIPSLLLNARNDPFVPAQSLPRQHEVGEHVTLWQPEHRGHVGFAHGGFPGAALEMPGAVFDWLREHRS